MKNRNYAEFFGEIGGFDSSGNAVFAWQFPVTVRSRVYLGGGSETEFSEPSYYTAAQVNAIVAELEKRIDSGIPDAGNIPIADPGNCFAAENVESALQELALLLGNTVEILEEI